MCMLFLSTVRMSLWPVYIAQLVVCSHLARGTRVWVNRANLFPLTQATEGLKEPGWESQHLHWLLTVVPHVYPEVEWVL